MRNPNALIVMIRELIDDSKVRCARPLACDLIREELQRFRAELAAPEIPATTTEMPMAP
ncbi:hypothetical protein HL667_33595 [Bradyrhizobium sp. 83012]|uniref:Uncharacterized protein n=1 Tax=Bradyrhizobium aeschynomenes TaxID=2734909 RepID=A0ABX2CP35_9BRAD|nr:hypothetical protein [Bradyrhizobium aeschynomenes]NPU69966.1 hypothetical protein [Bradyrhizobium aeschynomenes]